MTTADRTYFQDRPPLAWHGLDSARSLERDTNVGFCGRVSWEPEFADRVPARGHLCGSCARVIAARTDIE